MTGIYAIYNYEKNKIYIGQSIDIARRWQQHVQKANDEPDTSELYRDLHNAPFKMDFKILEICSEKELNEREQHHINSHKEAGYQFYNKISAPSEGRYATSKVKKKENRQDIINRFLNVPLTKSDKDKLCELLNYRNAQGRLLKWNTVKDKILNNGMEILETKRKIDGKIVNVSIIKVSWND